MAGCQDFEDMRTDRKENEKGVFDMTDCDPQAMEQFRFYVYSGKVETLNQDNVLGLYHVADKYQMMPLREVCSRFIKQSLSPSIICDVLLLALNHRDAELLDCGTQYFVDHINQILPTVGWMSLLKSNMIEANDLLIKATNKTTDETRDSKVSLKSQKKTISTLVCKLNVPNFFVLPDYFKTHFEVTSPSFEYANATWKFKFEEYNDDTESIYFDIYLQWLNYTNSKRMITCTIDLLDADGKKFDIGCEAFIRDDDDEGSGSWPICLFSNVKKTFYDWRDTLTLTTHLISEESFEEHADQAPPVLKRDVETLFQDYKKLFLNGKNPDLTLKVAGKEYRVHRDILMARCQAFETMLTHNMKEKEEGIIDVFDFDHQVMEQFLFYVYSGQVETLNQDNVLGLYYVADKYQMMRLREACSKFIKQSLSPSMVRDVVLLALNHSDAGLLEGATQYFVNVVAVNKLSNKATNKTTDETKDSKFSLTSQKKTVSTFVCTLNVPNFFILPEYFRTHSEVKSPSFEYANATWQFRFKEKMNDVENHSFDIYLLRLSYRNPKQMIICIIELLDAVGEKFDVGCRAFIMDDDYNYNGDDGDDVWLICNFNNAKSFHDRRDTLTLIIHLISDESFEDYADEVPLVVKEDFETLSQDYKKLFLNGKNQDLTLKVADKEFRVHQDILMARCQVFEAMLNQDMKEEEGAINVYDCDHHAMEQFLFYVYSGRVETLNQDNVLGLYHVADKYQMMPLKEHCSRFIKRSLSPSMICDVILLALNHSDADLLECATQYFINHFSQILPTVGWMSFLKSNVVAANELLIKSTKK